MLHFLTAGESHGPQLTTIVEGLPAGLRIDPAQINWQLERRQKGYGRGGRMKIESDCVIITSGVRSGITMGGPVTLVIVNKDWENWRDIMDPIKPISDDLGLKEQRLAHQTTCPRPGHADLAGGIKLDHHDLRNVLERASARETAARVAAGSLTRQLLESFGVKFASHVVGIGQVRLTDDNRPAIERIVELSEASEVRCINPEIEQQMIAAIKEAKKKRDSLGGVAEIIVSGLPVGLGGFSQWSERLDGRLAGALMSIQSVKSVEIGMGFEASRRLGSEVHDEIFYEAGSSQTKKDFYRKTNNAGGLEGGITNGEDIVVRIACKPISTLNKPLKSVDVKTKQATEAIVERTDNCVVPALAVIGEAVAAMALAGVFLEKFGSDNIAETRRNYESYLKTEY